MRRFTLGVILVLLMAAVALGWWYLNRPETGANTDETEGVEPDLIIFNWKDYFDTSIIEDFRMKTGCRIHIEEFETMDAEMALLQSDPDRYDLVSVSAANLSYLVEARILQVLDPERIPNLQNVPEEYRRDLPWAVPYLVGTTGLVVNTDFVPDSLTSWKILLDPAYKDRILLLDDVREVTSVLFYLTGHSPNSTDPKAIRDAEAMASSLKAQGVGFAEAVTSAEQVMRGEKWIAQVYGGIILQQGGRVRKNIRYILPSEGFDVWMDGFSMVKGARHPKAAHAFLDFIADREISARIGKTLSYISPIEGAMAYYNEPELINTSYLPSHGMLARGTFVYDTGVYQSEYARIFHTMKGK